MDREHVEKIMEGIAQVDMEVDEEMPKDMSGDKPSARSPTATAGPAREPTAEPTAVAVARGTATLLSSGLFHDQDAFHRGSGTAGIYRGPDGSLLLRLENLDVTNGPDLHVLLSTHPDPQRREDLESAKYIDLGKLKGNRGTQNYEIPDDVDVGAQATVIIYCLPFHVIFSVASLLEEELPLTSAAVLPSGTSREDAEKVMVEAAKVDEEVDEGVPAKMGTVKPLATPVPTATPAAHRDGDGQTGGCEAKVRLPPRPGRLPQRQRDGDHLPRPRRLLAAPAGEPRRDQRPPTCTSSCRPIRIPRIVPTSSPRAS